LYLIDAVATKIIHASKCIATSKLNFVFKKFTKVNFLS